MVRSFRFNLLLVVSKKHTKALSNLVVFGLPIIQGENHIVDYKNRPRQFTIDFVTREGELVTHAESHP